jgi:hypothetical protein
MTGRPNLRAEFTADDGGSHDPPGQHAGEKRTVVGGWCGSVAASKVERERMTRARLQYRDERRGESMG